MGQRIVQNHATLSFKVTYNFKSTWNSEDKFFFLVSPCGTSLAVYFGVCCFFWNYLSIPTFWFFYMKINCSLLTLSSPEISDPFYHKAAAAAAKSLQSCPTLCDPIDGSPPGSAIPGILQARTLSGLPFPPPMHESEKWKWSYSVVSDSSRPHFLKPTRLLCPWNFPGKSAGVGCHCLLRVCYLGWS